MRITPTLMVAGMAMAGVLMACGPAATPDAGKAASTTPTGEEARPAPAREAPSPARGATTGRSRGDPQQAALQGIPRDIPDPDPGAATPPVAAGALVEYACESGASLRIAYEGIAARVAWTDGGTLLLTRAAQDVAGGESYSGDGHVLLRRGNVIELGIPGGKTWRCMEAASSA